MEGTWPVNATLGDLIDSAVQRDPHKPAIISDDLVLTYGQLHQGANALAAALLRLGLLPGQRVGVLAPNTPYYPMVLLAVARAGGILVPLNTRATAQEIAALAMRVEMSLLFVAPQLRALAPGHLPIILLDDAGAGETGATLGALIASPVPRAPDASVEPDAPCIIMFTSGTSGRPKGVTISHRRYLGLMQQQAHECDVRPDDILQLAMPLYHNGGMVAVLGAGLAAGATIAMFSGSFDARRILDHARRHRVSIAHWIATMLVRLVEFLGEKPADLPHLRCIHYGSMPTTRELKASVARCFSAPLMQSYGSTDCGLITVLKPGDTPPAPDTTGRLLADTRVRIIDAEGRDVGLGEIGELIVDGATSGMMGYWGEPELSAQAIHDGWIFSGDLVRRDVDGFIALIGRKDNLIISGGENIYPGEVEEVVAAHPSVREVVICGVPDAEFGEVVCAIVAAEEGRIDLKRLREHCAGRIAAFKIPRRLVRVDALPRTPSGKIARNAARDMAVSS